MCFNYDTKSYKFDVVIMGVIYLIFSIASAYLILNKTIMFFSIPFFVVSIYNFYNRIVNNRHPSKICFYEEYCEFISRDTVKQIYYDEILRFHVKQFPFDAETYIWVTTVNEKYKLYVNLTKFSDNQKLLDNIIRIKTN